MGKSEKRDSAKTSATSLVRAGGKSEKRLLRRERQAELALKSARARVRKAQLRLERRLSAAADAEATLRGHQRARAIGPTDGATNGLESILVLPTTPEPSGNGSAPGMITGPDVATALAAMETTATAAAPATPSKRPSRAKSAAKADTPTGPATPPADLVIPAAKRRNRPSRAVKTTDGVS